MSGDAREASFDPLRQFAAMCLRAWSKGQVAPGTLSGPTLAGHRIEGIAQRMKH